MGKSGGTKMYCPKCKEIRVCKAIPINDIDWEQKNAQRWYRKDHPDINWFRRGRECLECEHHFITSEINEKYIDELVELRNALADIKKHSEQYIDESNQASGTLQKLSDSLSLLQALKLYKDTD
ncbi:hypothetical protein [Desulfobacula sp.]|uniref:hypothetical protein n=1 Tax=Desulfobacula sp. TaxID=2593537 RepID=UPI002624880A|nr:hypothetical protein [Desulfobacula sp.]